MHQCAPLQTPDKNILPTFEGIMCFLFFFIRLFLNVDYSFSNNCTPLCFCNKASMQFPYVAHILGNKRWFGFYFGSSMSTWLILPFSVNKLISEHTTHCTTFFPMNPWSDCVWTQATQINLGEKKVWGGDMCAFLFFFVMAHTQHIPNWSKSQHPPSLINSF